MRGGWLGDATLEAEGDVWLGVWLEEGDATLAEGVATLAEGDATLEGENPPFIMAGIVEILVVDKGGPGAPSYPPFCFLVLLDDFNAPSVILSTRVVSGIL